MDRATLNELKERLLALKNDLKNRINENAKRVQMYETGDEGDCSNAVSMKNTLYDLLERDRMTLIEVEEALYRIEKGTYGICEMCGEEIEIERMKAKPTARYCIKCRSVVESKRRMV